MPEDNRNIYITHCSAKKNAALRDSKKKVTPDNLYTATPTQRFMNEMNQIVERYLQDLRSSEIG